VLTHAVKKRAGHVDYPCHDVSGTQDPQFHISANASQARALNILENPLLPVNRT